jgi:hypothetical protein
MIKKLDSVNSGSEIEYLNQNVPNRLLRNDFLKQQNQMILNKVV